MTSSRSYNLTGFDAVIVSTGVRALVTTGGAHAVRVEAREAETLERLDVSVSGGVSRSGLHATFSTSSSMAA